MFYNAISIGRIMKKYKFTKWGIAIPSVLLISVVVVLAIMHITAGRSPSIRGSKTFILSFIRSTLDSRSVKSHRKGDYTSIIFLHQSTGRNLIEQGRVREQFQKAGYDFWDHDYNFIGLRDPNGLSKGYSYNVPGDNTNPDGLANIFKQPAYPSPFNTFSGLLQHEVIIIKSCFPNSNIQSGEQLAQNKALYLGMRAVMDQHSDKIFIVMTTPPLNPAETNSETAARARAMADWLKSDEFLLGHPNIYAFDFYSYLADDQPGSPEFNMLRKEYQDEADSHPNRLANETIGPEFVQFVIQSIDSFKAR